MRAISVLSVASPAVWDELEAMAPVADLLGEPIDATHREALPGFERELLPKLREGGLDVLVRYARRDAQALEAVREDLAQRIAELSDPARAVLHAAQRHALDHEVLGVQAWDPVEDASSVREIYTAGLLQPLDGDNLTGRYRLHPDLPLPPAIAYDFDEAVMPPTDDLAPPGPGAVALLHDVAALAAAVAHVGPRCTVAGGITKADTRRLGRRLGVASLAKDGKLEVHERWQRALRALEALGVVRTDPLTRQIHLDLGLERTLAGSAQDAVDRLVDRLVDRDLRVGLPAVRAALRQAGDDALDEVVFLDLLREQHRDIVFPRWSRRGVAIYPLLDGERVVPFDQTGWEAIEARMIPRLLRRMEHLGLVCRATGVFAATDDGRRWALGDAQLGSPVWISSDLELIVPPDAVTPWERFQLERLGRCLSRDVVDRYRLEREGLAQWLSTHELPEALDLLARRCPAVPDTVENTLRAWEAAATRVVLTHGVLLPSNP
jgi:hypothetical protein